MSQDLRRQTVANYIDAYNAGDVEAMLVLLSPQVRYESHFNDQLTASAQGTHQLREVLREAQRQFPERRQELLALRMEGDHAVASVRFSGLLTRDLPEGSIAGTELHLQGTSEFTFEGELISRIVDRSQAAGRTGAEPAA